MTSINFNLDESVVVAIVIGFIAAAGFMAVLAYRLWVLERSPLFSAVKEIQKQQLIDLIKKMLSDKGM